ncbi:BnaC02g23660D [Brassica napus]|uniref:(rape) hypothetical protein n=1 Tax=Brassica napus TaxID=3708 RepID=A0A078FGK6_BRANA|nr:unnamed protein product [Brassica napus]CDY13555.1 BnaC02g23660D [Brassica napus]
MYGWRITEYLNRFCDAVSYEDSSMLCRLLSFSSRMILKYLIPVKLSLGILPNDKLLPKYNLHEYMNVVQAPRKGDLRLRQHSSSRTRRSCIVAVFTAQQWLVSYRANRLNESRDALITEQLDINQVLEVRCLGKAGAPSLPGTHEENLSDPARGHQLKLEVIAMIAKALRWLEIDMDLDVMPVRINHGIEKV